MHSVKDKKKTLQNRMNGKRLLVEIDVIPMGNL